MKQRDTISLRTPKTNTQEKSILPYHDTRFDFARDKAETFVRGLGLHHARSLGKLAIIHDDDKARVAQELGTSQWKNGGYNPDTYESVVSASPDMTNPVGASQSLVSAAVHELTHSATVTSEEMDEHTFWREGMAGIGEALYLGTLEREGKRQKVADFVLQRGKTDIWVPGAFRYYENNSPDSANSSQGLIAATGFAISRQQSGETGSGVLAASRPGDRTHYQRMKQSFETLKPGLVREIESFPQTTDGIVQATAVAQEEGRKRGYLPPLRR